MLDPVPPATELHGACSVGLDVGGTKVHGVLLGPDGTVLGDERRPTRQGPEGVLASVEDVVGALVGPVGIAVGDLGGIGVGIPGLVDPGTGCVTHAVNVGIRGEPFPLADRLASRTGGVPVAVDNDLNVAAVGAAHHLARQGRGSEAGAELAYLALGTGLAAGIVLGGRLRRGVSGAVGEIGHVPVDPRGPRCACGQRGCLEVYASGSALASRWPVAPGLHAPAELFAAAARGDALAVTVRDEFLDAVAVAVQMLVLTYDVADVVIGGGVSALGEPLLTGVAAALAARGELSPFLATLNMADRVSLTPAGVPVAAVGAALVSRREVS
ncbi:NagC family transcriptional regulator [Paraoerskovia sediminicola]|uniref:NagC family transcriptional regulator n=1 Tax=Paraoerskovia sediminicola TaxID=1138587 RepID=A0ABM8FYW0_9CELL|nr:ROK family protein [Paraoerskovia sediminicola]BDZ40863.1 NagC family transcriptional regulator [Paraoerskovia sediminicola]